MQSQNPDKQVCIRLKQLNGTSVTVSLEDQYTLKCSGYSYCGLFATIDLFKQLGIALAPELDTQNKKSLKEELQEVLDNKSESGSK